MKITMSLTELRAERKICEIFFPNPRAGPKRQSGGGGTPAGRGIQSYKVSCIQHPCVLLHQK